MTSSGYYLATEPGGHLEFVEFEGTLRACLSRGHTDPGLRHGVRDSQAQGRSSSPRALCPPGDKGTSQAAHSLDLTGTMLRALVREISPRPTLAGSSVTATDSVDLTEVSARLSWASHRRARRGRLLLMSLATGSELMRERSLRCPTCHST